MHRFDELLQGVLALANFNPLRAPTFGGLSEFHRTAHVAADAGAQMWADRIGLGPGDSWRIELHSLDGAASDLPVSPAIIAYAPSREKLMEPFGPSVSEFIAVTMLRNSSVSCSF